MDFFRIAIKEPTKAEPIPTMYPDFIVGRSKDLMVRGRSFYAIWDEAAGLWSTDEYDVQRLVDEELKAYAEDLEARTNEKYKIRFMSSLSSGSWIQFRKYLNHVSDNSHQLDENLTFANTAVKKSDHVSRRLSYALAEGKHDAWDELIGTLYSVEERAKIEWAIGAVVSGDAKKIQKFLVLYGPAGTGKSTVLNIIQKLFEGYTTAFEAKALGSNSGSFATEAFKNNPLVAIQHDGDLSRIEDNTRLNSIIAHEDMTMNEKYKPSYTSRVNAFLFMGTNQPVKISDAKSGIIRRLIDVHPTGVRLLPNHYATLFSQIDFELGAIAHHCLQVYREMGKNYYNPYRPTEMMLQTDVFFNFIESAFDVFKQQDSTTLKQAYILYKEFCNDTGIERMLPQYKVREELRNYFDEFKERAQVDGHNVRSYYSGFNANKFKTPMKDAPSFSLVIEETESLLDGLLEDQPAQYATASGIPKKPWGVVTTTLADIDTSKLHFVKVPENHIVIDFDLKDEGGEKSLERNLEAASVWPATYAELSKGGNGVHLHYLYDGDVSELSASYSEGIEVKTLLGDASLRRKLTKCNNIEVNTFTGSLPKKEKKVLSEQTMKSEATVRAMIGKNLRKEYNPGTKTSVDFIKKILDDAYESGMQYDVTDLRSRVLAFANQSTHQSLQALKVVQQMKWKSEEAETSTEVEARTDDVPLAFYDIEVFPNLFAVGWKYEDSPNVVKLLNPSPREIEELLKLRLVGFYNRRYDNHILYAALQGYSVEDLYKLSQKIIVDNRADAMFGSAYELSYADVYDFASEKKTLKKWEVELGIKHMELGLPWDQPVPDDMVPKVLEYLENDVVATEAVFKARRQDYVARQILAELSGLTVNDTTAKHTARIIFGGDRDAKSKFVYTDLRKDFPGYEYEYGKSTYKGLDPSEGGFVYAQEGMYENVAVLDVASMHPTSIIQLNLFGPYTKNFQKLMDVRLALKAKDFEAALEIMPSIEKFITLPHEGYDIEGAEALAYALKIVINTVYGLTSARFDNPFKDPHNIDNIVAKRGALFMIDLKEACEEKGLKVVHIKTDSIKIPDATPEDIEEIMLFGEKYGYKFEYEALFSKFCLVNDAVYVAKYLQPERKRGQWEAVGAQFKEPFVYKTLFTNLDIEFDDLCVAKSVTQGAMYLDFEHDKPEPVQDRMQFIGKTGVFVPVEEGEGGAVLYRIKDDKQYAVAGTKGYLWLEKEMLMERGKDPMDSVDMSYFEKLAADALSAIEKFGDPKEFIS